MWLYIYIYIYIYIYMHILSVLLFLVFLTFRGCDRLPVLLWFVGQPRPVEVPLRAVLICFVSFVVIFFTLF
jgi:hypothetical protein